MATPVILYDSSTGSDSAASGAGPATAVTGTKGRTRNTASMLRVGFFEASPPDLSGVLTDGSHVLYIAIATAGQRNFSSIASTKNTQTIDTLVAAVNGSPTIADTATGNYTVNDVVQVTDGSTTIYSTIASLSAAVSITLADNWTGSTGNVTVTNPRQVGLTASQGLNTGTSDTTWAIGGKRLTLDSASSTKLTDNNTAAGDLMPGWIQELGSGYTATIAASINYRRAGDVTTGPIILRGASGGTRPTLTFSNNGSAIVPRASSLVFQFLDIRNSNATKTASVAFDHGSGGQTIAVDVRCATTGSKFWKFWRGGGAGVASIFINCEVGYTASNGFDSTGEPPSLYNCFVHDAGGHGGIISAGSFGPSTYLNNIFYNNAGDGLQIASSGGAIAGQLTIIGNTFHSQTAGSGLYLNNNSIRTLTLGIVANNIFSYNSAYGINCISTLTDAALAGYGFQIYGNDFYQNTSGKYQFITVASSMSEQTIDPSGGLTSAGKDYTGSTSAFNFAIASALKALGYPVGGTTHIGASGTYSYVDPGAAQRQEAGGSVTAGNMRGGFING